MTIPNSTVPEEERRIVSELTTESNSKVEPDSYFAISKSWYTSWERYVEQPEEEARRPGPINNHDIIETPTSDHPHPQLRRLLVEGKDYVLVPQQVWIRLLEWYNGGPQIPGNLICFYLSDESDEVCAMKKVSQARIWEYSSYTFKRKRLDPLSDKTLEESGLLMKQNILLEVDGSSTSTCQNAMSSAGNELALEPSGERRGLAGLVNMGNTCFMNSALQCLAHTRPILDYFLQDKPPGMSGELAKAFQELLKELWFSGKNPVKPRSFKEQMDIYAPQFSGFSTLMERERSRSLLPKMESFPKEDLMVLMSEVSVSVCFFSTSLVNKWIFLRSFLS